MIKPVQTKFFKKIAWLLLFTGLSINGAWAQKLVVSKSNKTTTKKPAKKKTKKPQIIANQVKIKDLSGTDVYQHLTKYSFNKIDSFAYCTISIPLILSGKRPAIDYTAQFKLDDQSLHADAKFDTDAGLSLSKALKIRKENFSSTGKDTDITSDPILIRFNIRTNKGRYAYITLANNNKPSYSLGFSGAYFDPKDNSTANSGTALNTGKITFLPVTTQVKLDTISRPDNTYPLDIKLKLGKGTRKDTAITLIVKPQQIDQTLKVSVDTINIASEDWNIHHDTIIKRSIALYIHQLSLLTHDQKLVLTTKNGREVGFVTVSPFKSSKSSATQNLVKKGQAIILGSNVNLNRYYPADSYMLDTLPVKVKLTGMKKYDTTANQLYFQLVDTTLSKYYKILNNPITLSNDDYVTAVSAKSLKINNYDTVVTARVVLKTINADSNLNQANRLYLKLKNQDISTTGKGIQAVKIDVKDKEFWTEIGTNFDLLDKIKTNNLYVGVYGYVKDVARIWGKKDQGNVSFAGGVYESQSVTQGSSLSNGFTYRNGSSAILDTIKKLNKYPFYSDTGRIKATTTVKNIGLFFSPQLRLTEGQTEQNGFHLFVSLYTELIWQRITSTLDYTKTGRNQTLYSANQDSLSKNVPFKESEFDLDFRSQYIGLGVPIYIKTNDFTMYVSTTMGGTTQRFVLVDESSPLNQKQYAANVQNIPPLGYTTPSGTSNTELLNFAQPLSRWNWFYLFQFRLTEVKYGITFSGEVRGLFLHGSQPVVTLALSKKFNLASLLKPILAPF